MSNLAEKIAQMVGSLRGKRRPYVEFGYLRPGAMTFDELRRAMEETAKAAEVPWSVRLVNDSRSGTIFVNSVPVIRIAPDPEGQTALGVAEEIDRRYQPLVYKVIEAFLRLEAAAREGARLQREAKEQYGGNDA